MSRRFPYPIPCDSYDRRPYKDLAEATRRSAEMLNGDHQPPRIGQMALTAEVAALLSLAKMMRALVTGTDMAHAEARAEVTLLARLVERRVSAIDTHIMVMDSAANKHPIPEYKATEKRSGFKCQWEGCTRESTDAGARFNDGHPEDYCDEHGPARDHEVAMNRQAEALGLAPREGD